MYKIKDLEKKSNKELLVLISELKGKLLALRFENATGQLQEAHLLKSTKKDIARIFTVLKSNRTETNTEDVKPAKETKAKSKAAAKAEAKEEVVVEEAAEAPTVEGEEK
jgi:large subunit ribosomal protein L29